MIRRVVAPILAVAALAPAVASAQGVCSAPHSAGGFSGGPAGAVEPGAGWLQLSGYYQRSDAVFGPNGGRLPLLADGAASTTSLYVTGAVGVLPGVMAWAQVPVHRLAFEDQVERRTRTGIGDIRAALRVALPSLGVPLPLAVRGGVKLPGTDFPVDARIIPLTEGQRDWEVSVEHGRSLIQPSPFVPPTVYAVAWIGYRWREANEEVDRKPGDELFAHLGFSGLLDPVQWGLSFDALWGGAPVQQGFLLPGSARRLWQVSPSLTFLDAGPGALRVAAQFSLGGRNLPTGTSFDLSYRLAWP